MPHVTIQYKMLIFKTHQRQPRNPSADLQLNPPSGWDATSQSLITAPYFDQLPYAFAGGTGDAKLMFWNVIDGPSGDVAPAGPLNRRIGANSITITAWYRPITGPAVAGNGGGTQSSIIIDAFSAALGSFIDDTFVTVMDASLTSQANVMGIVPTSVKETLVAAASVATTPEPFAQWMSFDAGTPSGATIVVPQGAGGFAIVIYQYPDSRVINRSTGELIVGTIVGLVPVDGSGFILINGVPHPIGPWGPLIARLVANSGITFEASRMDKTIGVQVRRLAAQDTLLAIKHAMPEIERDANG